MVDQYSLVTTRHPFPAVIILVITFSMAPSLCTPADQITYCLNLHNIKNFTTLPNTQNDSNSAYYKLLNFSIQNLRFAGPKISKPLAIILPESVEEVANSVLCCREASWQIRVRCGGHSYEGTSSVGGDTNKPFVILDMMNLNQVVVDMEDEMAWVEGGATLGEIYYEIAMASQELGFSAGSCPTVGVGGHVTGGGFGFLSRKYGVAADNVVDALLVDSEGELLDRKAMGEDVFWAIRGGGGGVWGVIYAWKIKLLKVPPTVTSFIVSRPESEGFNVAELVEKWQHVAHDLTDDFYLSCFMGAHLPETMTIGMSATFRGFFLGRRTQAISILNKEFPELRVEENDCTDMSWIESVLFFSGLPTGATISELRNRYLQGKGYFKAKSDYVRTPVTFAGIRTMMDILEKEPKGYVIMDPYGGIMKRITSDAIAFPHRKGNLFAIQYLVEWKEEDDEKREDYMDWMRGFYESMKPYVSGGPRAAYVNYMDLDLGQLQPPVSAAIDDLNYSYEDTVEIARVWGEKYFLKNYDRLVRAKTLVDPTNFFTNQQPIPPLNMGSSLRKIGSDHGDDHERDKSS
ncbi:reticuline oxidase-like [Carica papaya]|uniref:reticuline oxidase-like n=1 Tax=Carica papaya TaxID=3649 RepID=UPI000B8CCE18|nr:reticuline oxidase-like [Carica papaya]